jgi:hypothetical protein
MLAVLQVAFRIVMLFGGCLLLYTVVTMFPDEEGRLQNRIENLWVAIDDMQQSAVGRATSLFNRIASYVTRVYNRILGVRLISVQIVGVSSASSLAGFFLGTAFISVALLNILLSNHITINPQFNSGLLLIALLSLAVGSFALFFAVLPSLIRNRFGRALSLLPLVLFMYGMSRPIISAHVALNPIQLTVIAGLLIGIVSDILVLAAVRYSTRLISNSARLKEIVVTVLVQVGALVLLAVVPFELAPPLLAANRDSLVAKFLLSILLFNIFTMLGVATFLALLVVVMLHRIFWPLLGRAVYAIARFKPLQTNRKTFALVGIVCVMYGLGVLSWHGLIVWFVKRFAP